MQNEIHWYCDYCGDYMNYQKEFNTSKGNWTCTKCNKENDVSANNVGWTCDKCNVLLNEQDGFNIDTGEWKCLNCGCINNLSLDYPCEICGALMNEQEGFFAKVNSWKCIKCGTNYGPERDHGLSVIGGQRKKFSKRELTFHAGPINEADLVGISQDLIRNGADYLSEIILSDSEMIGNENRELYNRQIKPHIIKMEFIQRKLSSDKLGIEDESKLFIELDIIAMEIKKITQDYEVKQRRSFFKRLFGLSIKVIGEVASVALPYIMEQQRKEDSD